MGRPHKKSRPRVMVVDDHALFVEGLRLLLCERVPNCALRWAATCEQALESLRDDPGVDLVLFDPGLPGVAHGRAFELLQCAVPGVPVVFLSGDDRRRAMSDALRGGARGYIPKGASAEVLVEAVMLVLGGGTYIPKELGPAAPQETHAQLSPRERQVLRLVAGGLSNKEIAADLGLSESTVRVHVAAIGRGLGGLSRFELATSQVALALLRRDV